MKALKGGLAVLAFLLLSSAFVQAHSIPLSSKPITTSMGVYEAHQVGPIFFGTHSMEGSKPVLEMLGETPRTTLTTSHLRRETWVRRGDYLLGTKPVTRMLLQQLERV
jgi:hypothetical protein